LAGRNPIPGRLRTLAAALCIFAAGCSSAPRVTPKVSERGAPALSSAYILGPISGDGEGELASLQGGAPAQAAVAHLRRAWILMQTHRPQAAVDEANLVLFGAQAPSPAEQAFARFLRAEGYAALGDSSRANYERSRARELALDPDLRARLEAQPVAERTTNPVATPSPSLQAQPRSAWNPAPIQQGHLDPMGRIWRVTVHHSDIWFRDTSTAAAAAQIRQIQRQHMVDRGFGDIGYHYLIDPAGRIWEGRDLRWQGAHARGEHNKGNVGICVLGNFVSGSHGQAPTEAQQRALASLLTQAMQTWSIPVEQIHTHRDFVQTECPGAQLQAVVDRFVRDATAGRSGRVAARE
jgi:N-acetylmuramoyl-L-alanine amidase